MNLKRGIILLGIFPLILSGCVQPASEVSPMVKKLVMHDVVYEGEVNTYFQVEMEKNCSNMSFADGAWVIEQLAHHDPYVRSKAAFALGFWNYSLSATALYLAATGEKDEAAYYAMVRGLGRQGNAGVKYLCFLWKDKGEAKWGILVTALAQAEGVEVDFPKYYPYPSIPNMKAYIWWKNVDKSKFEKIAASRPDAGGPWHGPKARRFEKESRVDKKESELLKALDKSRTDQYAPSAPNNPHAPKNK